MAMADPIQRLYANAMRVHGGPYDVIMDFGERVPGQEEPEWGVRLSMSWEHAVSMVAAIQRVVDEYQETVGKVRDMEQVIANMEEDEPK